jgi:hypothetical protein
MVGCHTPHYSSLMLMKHLRPLEYGFVEFSRQKVRLNPTTTRVFLMV